MTLRLITSAPSSDANRAPMSVEQQIVTEFLAARSDRDRDRMRFLRSTANALDPGLVDELDGLDYPAAA